jgi:hypothetical protein
MQSNRYSCQILMKLEFYFLDRFSKITQIPNFMKIRPLGAELFHAVGRTHMTNLIVVFRNFAKVPKTYTPPRSATYLLCLVKSHASSIYRVLSLPLVSFILVGMRFFKKKYIRRRSHRHTQDHLLGKAI